MKLKAEIKRKHHLVLVSGVNEELICGIFLSVMDIQELQLKLNNLNENWQSIRGLL